MNEQIVNEGLIAYTAIVGAFMPLIVAVVVQSHWPKEVKGVAALTASILAGIGSVYIGGVELRDLGVVIPAILIASQASYQAFWKPTGLATAVEQASNKEAVAGRFASKKSSTKARKPTRRSSNPEPTN
jgi:hypothetical protein